MIPPYVDLILRLGRYLGTLRSLIVQTEQLLEFVDEMNPINESLVDGLEL